MKIAHINLFLGTHKNLIRKIRHQANAAREEGLDIDYYVIQNDEEITDKNFILLKPKWPSNPIKKIFWRIYAKYNLLEATIDLSKYDKIVIRHFMPIPKFHKKFLKKFAGKIISEHHTLEIEELRSLRKSFTQQLMLNAELSQGPRVLSSMAAIISVTNEIRESECKRAGKTVPSMTITNGTCVSEIKRTSFKPFDGRNLDLIFIAGSYQSWQGLPRLINSVIQYNGQTKLCFKLIGTIPEQRLVDAINNMKNANIEFQLIGSSYGEELDQHCKDAHCAISVLALHKKGLNESAPLKAREYMARGLPFIYAYDDPDIPDDYPYALKLPNDDSLINMKQVITFVESLGDPEKVSKEMRDYATKNLDWRIKVRQLWEFAKSI